MRAVEGRPAHRPRTDAPGQADLELLGALVIMLHRSSLLPWDKFAAALDRAGPLGLMNRIAAVTEPPDSHGVLRRYREGPALGISGERRSETRQKFTPVKPLNWRPAAPQAPATAGKKRWKQSAPGTSAPRP